MLIRCIYENRFVFRKTRLCAVVKVHLGKIENIKIKLKAKKILSVLGNVTIQLRRYEWALLRGQFW